MSDETTNESNEVGEEVADNVTPAEKVRKDTEELKAENDAYDKEKLRAETIRAERQRGGKAIAGQEEEVSPENKKQAQAKEFFKGTALGDAIKKTNE